LSNFGSKLQVFHRGTIPCEALFLRACTRPGNAHHAADNVTSAYAAMQVRER